jgi:CheY-like chemotaxis protein
MMGGQLWVESHPGSGSTFHFTAIFGAKQGELDSTAAAQRMQSQAATAPGSSRAANQGEPARDAVIPCHILLVEDNAVNQVLAVRLLERQGHSVVVASNGREAVEAFSVKTFDLILMDVQMPVMNGYEATAAIREKEKSGGGRIPIVALTAHAVKGDRERCLEAGMDGYLSKPIKSRELVDLVAAITQSKVSQQVNPGETSGGSNTQQADGHTVTSSPLPASSHNGSGMGDKSLGRGRQTPVTRVRP